MTTQEKIREITAHCETHYCAGAKQCCFTRPIVLDYDGGFCLVSKWKRDASLELAHPLLIDYLYERLVNYEFK